jgi:hypothetical protein
MQPRQQSAPERFARSFNLSAAGSEDPDAFLNNLKQEAANFQFTDSPEKAANEMLHGIHQGMQQTWEQAQDLWKKGDFHSATGLINRTGAMITAVESGVPIVGPALAQGQRQMVQGDIAGGLGTAAGMVAPILMEGMAPRGGVGTVVQPEAAPGRIQQFAQQYPKAVKRAAMATGGTVGGVLGAQVGLPHVGAGAGAAVGEQLAERYLRPAAPAEIPAPRLVPPEAGEAAVPAAVYFQAQREGEPPVGARYTAEQVQKEAQAARAQAAPPSPAAEPAAQGAAAQPAEPAAAPQAKPAEAKAATAAVQQQVKDVVDEAVPPKEDPAANRKLHHEVTRALEDGDTEAAHEAVAKATGPSEPEQLSFWKQKALTPLGATDEEIAKAAAPAEEPKPEAAPKAEAPREGPAPSVVETYNDAASKFVEEQKAEAAPTGRAAETTPFLESKGLTWKTYAALPDEQKAALQKEWEARKAEAATAEGGAAQKTAAAAEGEDLTSVMQRSVEEMKAQRSARKFALKLIPSHEDFLAQGGSAAEDIRAGMKEAGYSDDTVKAALDRLEDEGRITKMSDPELGDHYVKNPSAVEEAFSGRQNRIVSQYEYKQAVKEGNAALTGGLKSGANLVTPALKFAKAGMYHYERGVLGLEAWKDAMIKDFGERVDPYLDRLYGKITEAENEGERVSTRAPAGRNATEDPVEQHVTIDRATLDRDAKLQQKLADRVQGKSFNPEKPLRDALKKDGTPKYKNDEDFQDAVDEWRDQLIQYPDVRYSDKARADPVRALDEFTKHVKDNLVYLYNQMPERVRQLYSQWYDTARGEVVSEAQARGLKNRQVAGVYASLSPQKDWFMNRDLAKRVMNVYRDQQDATMSDAMRTTGQRIRGTSEELGGLLDSGVLEGKKFKDMSTDEKAAFTRLYDETYNTDRSYHAQTPDGKDLGPVQTEPDKKGNTRNAKVAWGSLNEIGKAISILEDDSMANIKGQLGGSHKVPNFYNNMLTPNHPGEYVTVDTHAVAAGHLRPLSGASPEVAANFGGNTSKPLGAKGTYALYADAYRQAAKELGILPRQLQSVTWEGIRDIFPAEVKTAENGAIIKKIWQDYGNGDIPLSKARKQVFEAAAKFRDEAGVPGGLPRRWSTAGHGYTPLEEVWHPLDEGELHPHGVLEPGSGQPESGGGVHAARGAAEAGVAIPPSLAPAKLGASRRAAAP